MSEQNQNPLGFPENLGEDGIDLSAIFGADSPVDGDPFADPRQSGTPAQQAAPATQEPPTPPAAETVPPVVEEPPAPVEKPEPETKQIPPQTSDAEVQQSGVAPVVDDPLGAAFAQKQAEADKAAVQSLFEKPPVFAYGSAKDPITDPAMTFEELRIAKSADFPELGEGKRVSWSVEYGKVTKTITDPKGKTIQTVKEEIERSKEFLDGLKKAKDKNPDCLVKPRVTAQSKGIAAYKGVFLSLEEAWASDKPICLIPSADGKVFELRKTEMGDFVAPKNNVVDFQAVRAGFTPALPLIPQSLLQQIISFFRCYMDKSHEFEALAHILWDKEQEEYTVHIPIQTVSKARVDADLSKEGYSEDRYIHYADIHSHNSMEAKFSPTDDADERATRLYVVVGRLDKFFPDVTVRMSCGGTYLELDPGTIFEGIGEVFPRKWRENVKPAQGLRIPSGACRLTPHFAADKEFFAPGEGV